jgi:hypothetical protein
MNFDPSVMPTTLDRIHLLLAVFSFVMVILYFLKAKSKSADVAGDSVADQPVSERPVSAQPTSAQAISESPLSEQQGASATPAGAAVFEEASPVAALQLLTLLQQEARFIDFISEDLTGHSDADIGAVARIVHEGASKTINEYFTLTPIRTEQEETPVRVPEGFNAAEIRLTGNVVGSAPFSGTLVHRGWKATATSLPKLAAGHDASIIAAAEVEL